MKNTILITLLFSAIPYLVQSQKVFGVENDMLFGLEAGISASGMNVANADIYPAALSYRAGIFGATEVFKFFFLEPGMYFESTGASMKGFLPEVYSGYVRDIDLKLNSFTIQLMVGGKNYLNSDKSIYVAAKIGTYCSYGLSSHASITGITDAGNTFVRKIDNAFKEERFTEAGNEYIFEPFTGYDFGGRYALDIVYKRFSLRTLFSIGFLKLHPSYDKKFNSLNGFVSLGYVLF